MDAGDAHIEGWMELAAERGCKITHLLQTHAHIDHVSGLAASKAALPDAPVYLHPDDVFLLQTVSQQGAMFGMGDVTTPELPDVELADGMTLCVGELSFEVLHTPGHCPGHVCFYCEDEALVFGGDLLFAGSIGRTDFPPPMGCSLPDMKRSLKRVSEQLPGDTLVFCGHNEATSIGTERASNPYLTPDFLG